MQADDQQLAEIVLAAIPDAPRTPSPAMRGVVYGWGGSDGVLAMIGALFTIVGVPLGLAFNAGNVIDLALDLTGESVVAVTLGGYRDTSVRVNDRNPYCLDYKYDWRGMSHTAAGCTVGNVDFSSVRVDDSVMVDVLPASPNITRLSGERYSYLGWIGPFICIFGLVGVPLLAKAVRSRRRRIRAYEHGVAGVARITRRGHDTSVKANGRSPALVVWTFNVNGETYTGQLSTFDESLVASLHVNELLPVVYDADYPAINTAYLG